MIIFVFCWVILNLTGFWSGKHNDVFLLILFYYEAITIYYDS
jgi:hypothetical protein